MQGPSTNAHAADCSPRSKILEKKSAYPKFLVALAWGVYGGAVAVRVGGRWVEMAAGIVIGMVAESGTVRLVYGLMCFGLLGAGIVAAFAIAGVLHLHPAHVVATKLPDLVVLACVAVGGLALVVCLEGRRRDVGWIVAAAVIAFGAQELTRHLLGERGAPILVAFILGCAAYLYARRPGRVPFTMLVPGLLQLAPGFLGTNATFKMLTVGVDKSSASYFDVIVLALQLGIGILVAGLLFKHRRPKLRPVPARAVH